MYVLVVQWLLVGCNSGSLSEGGSVKGGGCIEGGVWSGKDDIVATMGESQIASLKGLQNCSSDGHVRVNTWLIAESLSHAVLPSSTLNTISDQQLHLGSCQTLDILKTSLTSLIGTTGEPTSSMPMKSSKMHVSTHWKFYSKKMVVTHSAFGFMLIIYIFRWSCCLGGRSPLGCRICT